MSIKTQLKTALSKNMRLSAVFVLAISTFLGTAYEGVIASDPLTVAMSVIVVVITYVLYRDYGQKAKLVSDGPVWQDPSKSKVKETT